MGRQGVQKELLSDWVEDGGGTKGKGMWSQWGWCPEGQLGCPVPGKAELHRASGDGERPFGVLMIRGESGEHFPCPLGPWEPLWSQA